MEEQKDYENIIETDENITVSGEIAGASPLDQGITVDQQTAEIIVPQNDNKCCKSNHTALWLTILIATNAITASVVMSYCQPKADAPDAKVPAAVQEEIAVQPSASDVQSVKPETAAPVIEQKAAAQPETAAVPQEKAQEPVAADVKKDEKAVQDQDVKPAVQAKKISVNDVSPRLLKSGKSRFILIHADYIPQICEQVKDAKLVLSIMDACLELQDKIENSGVLLQNERIQIDNQTVLIKEIKNGVLAYIGADKADHNIPLAELAAKYATNYEYIVAETAKKEKKSDLLPAYFAFSGDYAATDKYAKRLSSKNAKKKVKKLQAELPAIVKIAYTCTKDEQTKKELFNKFAKDIPDAFKK